MQAIVELNGKQYQVTQGRYIDVDLMTLAPEASLTLDKVQLIVGEGTSLVGAPYIAGAKVQAKVVSHGRTKKILVYKMRCKKGYRRKNGHRQGFTRIQIESILAG